MLEQENVGIEEVSTVVQQFNLHHSPLQMKLEIVCFFCLVRLWCNSTTTIMFPLLESHLWTKLILSGVGAMKSFGEKICSRTVSRSWSLPSSSIVNVGLDFFGSEAMRLTLDSLMAADSLFTSLDYKDFRTALNNNTSSGNRLDLICWCRLLGHEMEQFAGLLWWILKRVATCWKHGSPTWENAEHLFWSDITW